MKVFKDFGLEGSVENVFREKLIYPEDIVISR